MTVAQANRVVNGARADHVGSNAQGTQLDRQVVGQRVDTGLGGSGVVLERCSGVVEAGRDKQVHALGLSDMLKRSFGGVVGSIKSMSTTVLNALVDRLLKLARKLPAAPAMTKSIPPSSCAVRSAAAFKALTSRTSTPPRESTLAPSRSFASSDPRAPCCLCVGQQWQRRRPGEQAQLPGLGQWCLRRR